MMKFVLSSCIILFGAISSHAQTAAQTLTIYTYSSFVSDWGPGPAIKEAFEPECDCQINFVALEDGAALLSRLKLEGKQTRADIILGLDTSLTSEATATGLLARHRLNIDELNLSIDWVDPYFLPYDYGHFAFVYDSEVINVPPDSMKELIDDTDGPQLIIQDPRTSTPGLGLLLWMRAVFGENTAAAWSKLTPRILTVTAGWSQAYGLFLEGEAPLVLSYTTSPAYHRHVEGTDRYRAAEFLEGHYAQIEVAAKISNSPNQLLADQFLAFMLSPTFQDLIPTTNWMFPVGKTSTPLPKAFTGLVKPTRTLLIDPEQVAANRRTWVKEWINALSK